MAQMNQIIENTMVSGYSVPPEQEDRPDYLCPRCGLEMPLKATVYEWDTGDTTLWLCDDCIKDAVASLDDFDRAEMCGESVSCTRQLYEGSRLNAGELASLLYIDTKIAEEVA
jgi:hypothetical protein